MVLYANYGNITFKIDNHEVLTKTKNDIERYQPVKIDLSSGIHKVECLIEKTFPLPQLSISTTENTEQEYTYLEGPFLSPDKFISFRFLTWFEFLFFFFGLIFFFFFIPFFNHFMYKTAFVIKQYPSSFLILGWLVAILVFIYLHLNIYQKIERQYEADEAAFGLMSENLLLGQSPPLFHYGQPYQGTFESFPLSFSLFSHEEPSIGLKFLPRFWGICFILLTTLTFILYGNFSIGLFVFLLLTLSGIHFHWIISKAWFGYSFTLFCGSLLFLISLHVYNRNTLSPGLCFLWGVISGIALYELPIALPFVIVSGSLFIYALIRKVHFKCILSKSSFPKKINSYFLPIIMDRSFLAGIVGILLFSFPYYLSFLPIFESGAAQFLVKGRVLPPPRVPEENPLFDRFLDECLPTILGSRAPHNQLNNLPEVIFPDLIPLIFLLGLLIFPFISGSVLPKGNLLHRKIFCTMTYSLIIFTILIVTYSPFGIWPWYLLPIYWSLPILLITVIFCFWSWSPAIAAGIVIASTISFSSSLSALTQMQFQPSSLASAGLPLPTDFSRVKAMLRKNNVRYVISDQGFDIAEGVVGRDWIGESLTFDSNMEIIALNRLLRRLPSGAQELIQSSRVAYLFHSDYYFNNPPKNNQENYTPLSFKHLDLLFGQKNLNYNKLDCGEYILYIPEKSCVGIRKDLWEVSSSNPVFLQAAYDHNMGIRAHGREAYWSSGPIPEDGAWIRVKLDEQMFINRIILFHGTKIFDYPRENEVWIINNNGVHKKAGSLEFDFEVRSSGLILDKPTLAKEVLIKVFQPEKDYWWTIFEMWII